MITHSCTIVNAQIYSWLIWCRIRWHRGIRYEYTPWHYYNDVSPLRKILFMRFRLLDKVTEILIAYNRRKCQAILVLVRVKKRAKKTLAWWNIVVPFYACASDSTNVFSKPSSSLYCAMQLVRKSFSTRSRRAVFVRWSLNDNVLSTTPGIDGSNRSIPAS